MPAQGLSVRTRFGSAISAGIANGPRHGATRVQRIDGQNLPLEVIPVLVDPQPCWPLLPPTTSCGPRRSGLGAVVQAGIGCRGVGSSEGPSRYPPRRATLPLRNRSARAASRRFPPGGPAEVLVRLIAQGEQFPR
jgi:hypothetical protein